MKHVKITATLGPASLEYDVLKEMIQNGANVIRINLSYGTHDQFETMFNIVKKVEAETGIKVQTMFDTRGPEIRVGKLLNDRVEYKLNDLVYFVEADASDNASIIPVKTLETVKNIKDNHVILGVNNTNFEVVEVKSDMVVAKVVTAGPLKSGIKIIIPDHVITAPFLNEKDKGDIILGIKSGVDYVALSFVNCKEDVFAVRELLKEHNSNAKIMSKIESSLAVKNLADIIEASDEIMIARGDLAIEVGYENTPHIQKMIAAACLKANKPFTVATEMLTSMENCAVPTRAEANDVAVAVYSGASSTMLSNETAIGKYPVECIKVMRKVIEATKANM